MSKMIASLATSSVSSVVTPANNEFAVYYDFEGDLGDRMARPLAATTLRCDGGKGIRRNARSGRHRHGTEQESSVRRNSLTIQPARDDPEAFRGCGRRRGSNAVTARACRVPGEATIAGKSASAAGPRVGPAATDIALRSGPGDLWTSICGTLSGHGKGLCSLPARKLLTRGFASNV